MGSYSKMYLQQYCKGKKVANLSISGTWASEWSADKDCYTKKNG